MILWSYGSWGCGPVTPLLLWLLVRGLSFREALWGFSPLRDRELLRGQLRAPEEGRLKWLASLTPGLGGPDRARLDPGEGTALLAMGEPQAQQGRQRISGCLGDALSCASHPQSYSSCLRGDI